MGTTTILKLLVIVCCLTGTFVCQNELQEDFDKLTRANNFFAANFYNELTRNSSSFVYSPLSISTALSMLSVGANGNSLAQLNQTLGFTFAQLSEQELLAAYPSLVSSLIRPSDGSVFKLANAQFVRSGFPIYANYSRIVVNDFQAEARSADFANGVETLSAINSWVSNATEGKIDTILEELDPLAVMVLLNAVYFKAEWKTKFDERLTHEVDFFTENGTRKRVKMMAEDISCKHQQRHPLGGSVLELFYKDETFSIVFLLPQRGGNLTQLEEQMTPDMLAHISDTLVTTNVTVGIPKLKLEGKFNLIPRLRAVGVTEIFTDNANLSRISSEGLIVSQVAHRAVIELTEEGAEAAAATAVVTSTRTASVRPHFWLNRPFMFFLRHNPSNTILFMGRVTDV